MLIILNAPGLVNKLRAIFPVMEVENVSAFAKLLDSGKSLVGLRLQDLDLTPFSDQLLARTDVQRLAVLGGCVPPEVGEHLRRHGAFVFPNDSTSPINPYRAYLYSAEDLYNELDTNGYQATVDACAYRWSQDGRLSRDALVTMLRAIHDDAMSDALTEAIDGRLVVGVMGGHGVNRGDDSYTTAARLGWSLANVGLVVLTGGGPGAMEAANLGAFVAGNGGGIETLESAIKELARVPNFRPSIDEWAKLGMSIRSAVTPGGNVAADSKPSLTHDATKITSIGIPTWFYGHEPPNVFCHGIAKYFSNAVREDGILSRCNAGVVVMPGAAGTVQEIFQAVTPRYYAEVNHKPVTPLILVGSKQWTETLPVWDAVQALGQGRLMSKHTFLVETAEEAFELLVKAKYNT